MSEAAAVLLAIAGIATTLAGFSGLMIAFRPSRGRLTLGQMLAVRTLVMISISAMILALAPVPFLYGGAREGPLWAVLLGALGTHILFFATVVPFDLRRRRIKMTALFLGFTALHGAVGLTMMAGALDIAALRGPATYMAGVTWLIVICAAQLLVAIFAMLAFDAPKPPTHPEGEKNAD